MIRVAIGICSESGKILMGRRRSHDGFFGDYWEFPGGKIEAGESEEQALRREFQEELGVEVSDVQFFKRMVWEYPNRSVELHFYLLKISPSELLKVRLTSHSELKWFTRDEALSQKILPANIELIRGLSL